MSTDINTVMLYPSAVPAYCIIPDDAPQAAVPLAGNLIALGNRSTNALISALYDGFYTLLDLKYPGSGGHVVRTLHDPFATGHNAILVGGSDPEGVATAARKLIEGKKSRVCGKCGEQIEAVT